MDIEATISTVSLLANRSFLGSGSPVPLLGWRRRRVVWLECCEVVSGRVGGAGVDSHGGGHVLVTEHLLLLKVSLTLALALVVEQGLFLRVVGPWLFDVGQAVELLEQLLPGQSGPRHVPVGLRLQGVELLEDLTHHS